MHDYDFEMLKGEIWVIMFHAAADAIEDIYGMTPDIGERISYAAADAAEKQVREIELDRATIERKGTI